MRKATIDDVAHPPTLSPASVLRPLAPALETEGFALNYFELAPGDRFGFDYHRHRDQEEVFYVVEGTVTFETEAGDVAVAAGEVVRFAPGEFQLGHNRSGERVVALAIGAPRESTAIEYLRACPTCGDRTVQAPEIDEARSVVRIRCTDCETAVDERRF